MRTGPLGASLDDAAAELCIRLCGAPAGAGLALGFTKAEVDASFGGLILVTIAERNAGPHTIAVALKRFRAEPDLIPILGSGSIAARGSKPSADAGQDRDTPPDCPAAAELMAGLSRPSASTIAQLVERWHRLSDTFDRAPAEIAAAAWLVEWAELEQAIVERPARGDADLIAKAGAVRRIVEQDGEPEGRLGRLTLSLLDDVERLIDHHQGSEEKMP